MAYNRRRTRNQNDRSGILRKQSAWLGENRDSDPTTLAEGEVALLENAIAYEKHVEERPGSWLYSESFELVGNCDGKFFHKASKRWIFHVEGHLYWSDFDAITLTEIFDYADGPLGENLSPNGHTIMKEFLDGVLITIKNASRSGLFFVRISKAVPRFYELTAKCPIFPLEPHTPDVTATLHRYRFVFTFSRIEGADGDPSLGGRLADGAVVVHESGTATKLSDNFIDYTEVAITLPIDEAFPTISLINSQSDRPIDYAADSAVHWTHLSVYRTLDISSDFGADSKTGEVNDPNVFIWEYDALLVSDPGDFLVLSSDEILRSRISSSEGASAFILKSRGMFPIGADANYGSTPDTSEVSNFATSPNFIFAVRENAKTQIDYCQLATPYHAGYHNPLQNKKFAQEVNAIQIYQNLAVFCHTSSMSGGDLNAYQDRGPAGSPMFTLESFYPLDQVNGVTDYATIAETENGKFIAVCSDKSVRIFGGVRFGDDLCQDTISSEIMKKAVTFGAVAKFFNGAYLLWFSDSLSGDSNERCIRFAVHKSAGRGWSEYWDFLKANRFHVGEIVVDDNGFHRLISQDFDDGFLYEIETYNGPEGSGIFRAVRDKMGVGLPSSGEAIVSRVKLPDYTGELESFLCRHQVTNAYVRARNAFSVSSPYFQESSGFAWEFSLDVNGYADGELADTITGAPVSGDLEFHNPVAGNRIGVEFIMNAGGWRLVRSDTHFRVIDQKKTEGINETNEAGYMTELEADRVLWISRGKNLGLERCLGAKYEILIPATGTYSGTTGPDGEEESGILFGDGVGSVLLGQEKANRPWLAESHLTNFTLSFWYKSGAAFTAGDVIRSLNSVAATDLQVYFSDATTLNIQLGGVGVFLTAPTVNNSNWHFFVIKNESNVLTVYVNDSQVATGAMVSDFYVHRGQMRIGAPTSRLFDMCLYSAPKSVAALSFYYNDIIGNSGKKALPYF